MSQGDLFRKGPSGEQLKKQALAKFELHETVWIERVRLMLCNLLADGQHLVSSDDAWRYCPPPKDVHPSVMGTVFRSGIFIHVGWIASTRPSAHARVIRTYRLRGDNE